LLLQGTWLPPPTFRESISWIISPFKFWTETIFLHAHLPVVYYKCVKFHKNPISHLGGVVLTRYMDGRKDGRTDRVIPIYPQTLFAGGIKSFWILIFVIVDVQITAIVFFYFQVGLGRGRGGLRLTLLDYFITKNKTATQL
jgi:hypothetical protein